MKRTPSLNEASVCHGGLEPQHKACDASKPCASEKNWKNPMRHSQNVGNTSLNCFDKNLLSRGIENVHAVDGINCEVQDASSLYSDIQNNLLRTADW